jgi:hypothetical protein
MNTCWDLSQCTPHVTADGTHQLNVYIYPKMQAEGTGPEHPDFVTNFVPYDEVIAGVLALPWVRVVEDPAAACILLPRVVDLQGFGLINSVPPRDFLARMLSHWRGGRNHVLFEFTDTATPPFDTGRAVVMRSNCRYGFCRHDFDVPFPIYQRYNASAALATQETALGVRKYLLTFKGTRNREKPYRNRLGALDNGRDVLVLLACDADFWMPLLDRAACERERRRWDAFSYDDLLVNTTFALVPEGTAAHTYRLFEVMQVRPALCICSSFCCCAPS